MTTETAARTARPARTYKTHAHPLWRRVLANREGSRRALYASRDLPAGTVLTEADLLGIDSHGLTLIPLYDVLCDLTGFGNQKMLVEERTVVENPDEHRKLLARWWLQYQRSARIAGSMPVSRMAIRTPRPS